MNRSPLLCLLIIPAVLLGVANSCKKKGANSVNPSYEGLGIITVQYLTGFALNGDPLCRGTDESVLRWSADKKEWSRVGTLPKINSGYYFEAKCEDALGNFYGVVFDSGCYILPQGATTWAKLNLHSVDSNMSATSETKVSLLSNNNGDIAMLSENRLNTHVRIFRKMAASNTWELVTDDSTWIAGISSFADNGDIYLGNNTVIKAGTKVPIPLTDCTPASLNTPYCGYRLAINPAGGIVFCGGAGGAMYQLDPGASYPAIPKQIYNAPADAYTFNGGFEYLSDGTCLGISNKGGYDDYYLYIRKNGADGWAKVNSVSQESPKIMWIKANGKGDVYCAPASPGYWPLYRLHY